MAELEIVQDEGSDTLAMAEAVKRRKKKARRAVSDFTVHPGKDCTATESSASERDTTEDIPVCTSTNFLPSLDIDSSRPPPTTQRNLQVNSQSYVVNPTLTSGQSEDRRSLAKLSTATQLSKFEESPEDNSWESVTSRKPSPKKAVLFLGNLKANIQEDELRSFIVQRAASTSVELSIYDCRIFPKVDSSSARIVVNDKCSSLLKRRDFWPRPLYCRPCNFEKYATTSSDSEKGSYKAGEDEHGTAGNDNQETSAQTDESTARRVQTRSQQK